MKTPVLIFSDSLPQDQKARIAEHCALLDFSGHDRPRAAAGFDQAVARAEGAIGAGMRWSAEMIARASRLRVVSSVTVGVDNYDVAALTARGIRLGHTPEVLTETTADAAMALLLATARRVVELNNWVAAGLWCKALTPEHFGVNVHHKRLGIVGMGRIGEAVARRARFGFAMNVVYHNRSRRPDAEAAIGARLVSFDELLSTSDFVCSVLPASAETRNRFDAGAFRRMPRHAIFLNIGRGAVVDEQALAEALDAGELRAAGLDVFQREPVGADHPLVGRDDVIVLPHAGSATAETRHAMARLAVDNLLAGLGGRPMPACFNAAALR